jgi:ribosomal protein S12 methylthiotransferase accessory factor
VGIVREVFPVVKDSREPRRPHVHQAILSNFDYHKGEALERTASGKGLTAAASETSAIVEALERYCATQRNADALRVGTQGSLDAPAIAPHELVLYSRRQYEAPQHRYVEPNEDTELTWVRSALLGSDRLVYAPAFLVYMDFVGAGGSERFSPTTSNGLGGGPDLPSAVLAGLLELVERDAFLVTWLNRLAVPRIDLTAATGIAAEVYRHYLRVGVETVAFDLTTDLEIPAVMAIGFDRSGAFPSATVGLGCSVDPATAIDRAVMEVAQIRTGTVPMYRRSPGLERPRRYEDVHTLEDHGTFAADPANLGEFDFLFDGPLRAPADLPDHGGGNVEADLDHCRKRLESSGSTVAYADLTLPDIEAFGVKIARAIATRLQPMHFGFGEERLGGSRLFEVPRLLGHSSRDTTEDDLNPCPHPLA